MIPYSVVIALIFLLILFMCLIKVRNHARRIPEGVMLFIGLERIIC